MWYIQWNTTQPLKKNKILPFAEPWMDLEGIMLTEISQTEKEKYCMISLIHNELVNIPKKQQTHRYREETSGYQQREGRGCDNIGVQD